MAEFNMLDEITHYCTRCKLDLKHRIVGMVEGVPKRMLCLTCQTERVYRPKAPAARRAAAGKAAAERLALEEQWKAKIHSGSKTPKSYSMDGIYKTDDIIQHQQFGLGLARELVPPDKIQIFFDDGTRLMKCGKSS